LDQIETLAGHTVEIPTVLFRFREIFHGRSGEGANKNAALAAARRLRFDRSMVAFMSDEQILVDPEQRRNDS
jgi:hypothetical protein